MPVSDLFKLAGQVAPQMADPNSPLNGGISQIAATFQGILAALQGLVEIEKPAETNAIFKDEDATHISGFDNQLSASFVSRWVDVSLPVSAPGPIDVRFLDPNNQTQAFHDSLRFYPGDFRSFNIRSRGILLSCPSGPTIFFITYWR